ncbi:Transposase [Shigella dysenteriae 1617]|uniref:Transposase n=1 Tax=Shigella dysenteriae 1617 TaxID=754093 RepID=A0A0A6ZQP4_SHIDY|nr:Transposase [Shigella dysenteriae 1617]
MPKDKHLTGKIFTQRIERNNLTLRTRIKRLARKTICFSRSVEIHEKVIGTFIERDNGHDPLFTPTGEHYPLLFTVDHCVTGDDGCNGTKRR